MLRTAVTLFLSLVCLKAYAQTPYFQQEVNYTINATLNDRNHTLDATVRMEYYNRAPDTLREIWIHLWANAYRDRSTAFCRQKLREGSTRFYFAPDSTLGGFENLDFSANGRKIAWTVDARNPDIALLQLEQPVPPGGMVVLETPFRLKIPASFSRLGHVRTSYQMTQWYPKPAVYDARGWHAMPYLDMGEFYSEFGSYDVSITLPDNYVVGATGVLQNPVELDFLRQKELETRQEIERREKLLSDKEKMEARRAPFPASSATVKTLHYTAENVHDFAWFADKRFYVLRDTARLAGGRTIDCWAMFTAEEFDLWKKGAFYVRRAVEFYSHLVGEYPWPQATAVHSALSAGGGMEYPMITVIGTSSSAKALDEVITHEVGHNWFYGILASNERDHPWLDEGLNSYYEHRYMTQYYGSDGMSDFLPRWAFDPSESGSVQENACLMLAREGADTPPDTHSDEFWTIAYGIQAYMKTAMTLNWLERAIGKPRFDQAMQTYYERWKFRHPHPDDLRAAWRDAGLEADWFFQAMQTRKRFDMALTRIKHSGDGYALSIKNRGALQAPFSISALRAGRPVLTRQYPAFDGRSAVVTFPEVEADVFALDHERVALDVNRKNNYRRTSGLFPGFEPFRLRALAPVEQSGRSVLGLLPWIGWNNYDKTMIGALLYNPPFPPRRFQYFLLPGFAIGSQRFVGLADVRYRLLPGGLVSKLTLGVNAKLFDYDRNPTFDYTLRFYRLAPQVQASLRSGSPAFSHDLTLRSLFIGKEEPQFVFDNFFKTDWKTATIHELRYEARQRALPSPFRFSIGLEGQVYNDPVGQEAHYLRSSAEWRQHFYYKSRRKISLRMFAGYFLLNTQRERSVVAANSLSDDLARGSFALNPQGFNDYRFDQFFLGRSAYAGIFSQQVSQSEGGFKNAFGAPYARRAGNSNNFIFAINLITDLPPRLPLGLPLKPYFDAGYFDAANFPAEDIAFEDQFFWSGGLMLSFLDGSFEVYFPLLNARPLRDLYQEAFGNNYFRRITWSFRIGKVTPMDIIKKIAN